MVARTVVELLPCRVRFVARVERVDEERVAGSEEGDEVDDLLGAAVGERLEEDASEDGLEGKGRHALAKRCDAARLVDSFEPVEGGEGGGDCRSGMSTEFGIERMDSLDGIDGLSMYSNSQTSSCPFASRCSIANVRLTRWISGLVDF